MGNVSQNSNSHYQNNETIKLNMNANETSTVLYRDGPPNNSIKTVKEESLERVNTNSTGGSPQFPTAEL